MTDAHFWQAERDLWTGGPSAIRRWVAAESLFVVSETMAVLDGTTVLAGSRPAPFWESVTFAKTELRRLGTDAAVLAYHADADRPGITPWRGVCTSTYVRHAGNWWLFQHQSAVAA